VDAGATLYRWDDLPKEALKPDLGRRLISTDRMMLAHVYLDEGAIVPLHSHENEQLTYILEGVLRFWLGEDATVRARLFRLRRLLVCGPPKRGGMRKAHTRRTG